MSFLLTSDLYTVDLESDKLEIDFREINLSSMKPTERMEMMAKTRHKKEATMMSILKRELTTKQLLEKDNSIRYMRINYRSDFYEKWNQGLALYFRGDWSAAKKIFEDTIVD